MAFLAVPGPFDFALTTERFRAFGVDRASVWHEGGLHRVVGGRELRIEAATGGVDAEPLDDATEPVVRSLLGLAFELEPFYAWAAADASPVDGVAFVLAPEAGGHAALTALSSADRWMNSVAPTGRTHWIIAASAPAIIGEVAQRRLLHHVLAWATAHASVRGVVLGDAADYDRVTGFRSATGRMRPIVADVASAIRVLFETPATVTP